MRITAQSCQIESVNGEPSTMSAEHRVSQPAFDAHARHNVEQVGGVLNSLAPFAYKNERASFHTFAAPGQQWFLKAPVASQAAQVRAESRMSRAAGAAGISPQTRDLAGYEEILLVERIMGAPLPAERLQDACVQTQLFALLDKVHTLPVDTHALVEHDIAAIAQKALLGLAQLSSPRPLDDTAIEAYLCEQISVMQTFRYEPAVVHGDVWHNNIMTDLDGRLWLIDGGFAHMGDPLEDIACPLVHADVPQEDEEGILGLALRRLMVPQDVQTRFNAVMAVLEVYFYAHQAARATPRTDIPSLQVLAQRLQNRSGRTLHD